MASSTRVTKSNLFSESWNNVFNLVNTRSNVADPISVTASQFRKFVYSREPDVKSADFGGYPFIIVNASQATIEPKQSHDRKSSFVSWIIEIEVVASDRGVGSNDGKGLVHADAISDDLFEAFNSVTNRDSLKDNGMLFSRPESTPITVEPLAKELTYRRSILLPFRSRITISS